MFIQPGWLHWLLLYKLVACRIANGCCRQDMTYIPGQVIETRVSACCCRPFLDRGRYAGICLHPGSGQLSKASAVYWLAALVKFSSTAQVLGEVAPPTCGSLDLLNTACRRQNWQSKLQYTDSGPDIQTLAAWAVRGVIAAKFCKKR